METIIYFYLDNGKIVMAPNNFTIVGSDGFIRVRATGYSGRPNIQRLRRISALNENRNYETKSPY